MIDTAPTGKRADAYRTIGEAAEELRLPQHVLRFWETRFPQVKPLKRAGGRRFYRPEDVALLGAIKTLLYGEGYTIKGVQRLLTEQGPDAVMTASVMPGASGQRRATRDEGPMGPTATPEPSIAAIIAHAREAAPMLDDVAGVAGPGPAAPSRPPAVEADKRSGFAVPDSAAAGPAWTSAVADATARLEALACDLAECGRLLSAVRAVRP